MRNLGNRANEIPDEHEEIELGTTTLSPQIEKFYKKWGKDYQPKFAEDMPTTIYEEEGV